MSNKRVARLVVRDSDTKKKIEIGSVFRSQITGSYSFSFNLWDKETKERTPIVALKPEGKEPIRLGKGFFVNLEVYDELEALEPYEPKGD